ncbi:MAG: DNA topoisomerase (ATP-hydrolyzing) subunit B [Candidatus Buchananbacteria bacterium]|nr:DNA topoisomerase (ATP-hydrolyzing) subunit B [Candidatus Buchananbacteria bacterium]
MAKKNTKPAKKAAKKISKPKTKTSQKTKKTDEYGAKQITVLEGLEPVRKRPGMYIGNTAEAGLHHLIWEVVDNGIDEAMAGFCDQIIVTLTADGMVSVADNGRGIPVEKHKATKKSALETVLTKLHAGGKFGEGGYKVSGGLHGVGVSVVNALSEYLKAEVKRNNKLWEQEYKRGKPLKNVKAIRNVHGSGTRITFKPDPQIFTTTEFNLKTIIKHLRQQAYLTKGIKIIIRDERNPKDKQEYTFYFEGGIASYVRYLNHKKDPKHDNIFYIQKAAEDIQVEISLQYVDEFNETTFTFANNIYTVEGGMHLIGFKTALTRTLNNFARSKNILKEKDENLTGDDTREGLTAIVSVKLKDPQFEGQTKAKLGNAEVKSIVDNIMAEYFGIFLEEHPRDAEAIIGRCLLAAKARLAAKSARETILRKGALDGFALPGKLADCSSKNADNTELYIVEGDSAGGSAKQGRDRGFQAILPLRGKILNVERARIDKMLANNELKSLIIALGTNIGEQFNIEDLRYNKIIIMTDADVDGAHIKTLLLTLFYRYFPELIKKGRVFVAKPPLYSVGKGKESRYAYSDDEKNQIIAEIEKEKEKKAKQKGKIIEETEEKEEKLESTKDVEEIETKSGFKINIQRYKGLGEMNPDQLWQTTMDPQHRVMKKINIEDAAKADEIFEILMGNEVENRKRFIQARAQSVKNLDV